jgi:hypothetical protein
MSGSALVAFASLLLGLIIGPWQVALMVSPPVTAVRLELDGQRMATLEAAPWKATVDFGDDLLPHRLDAVGLDGAGRELCRATQWINMPRPETEVDVMLARDEKGVPVAANVAWAAVKLDDPQEVHMALDGQPLPMEGPTRASLPQVDLSIPHVLRVEAVFRDDARAAREVIFGGAKVDHTAAELTAVPVTCQRRLRFRDAKALEGALHLPGKAAAVEAVEATPVRVLVVVDARVRKQLRRLAEGITERWERADTLGFVDTWPRVVQAQGIRNQIFRIVRGRVPRDFRILLRAGLPHESDLDPELQKLGDAVALAGIDAAAGSKRRAVVFLAAGVPPMPDEMSGAQVRRLLAALKVPLRVWCPLPDVSTEFRASWGSVQDTSTTRRLRAALADLQDDLDEQHIVWIEGIHLPQDITFAGARTRCRPAT